MKKLFSLIIIVCTIFTIKAQQAPTHATPDSMIHRTDTCSVDSSYTGVIYKTKNARLIKGNARNFQKRYEARMRRAQTRKTPTLF